MDRNIFTPSFHKFFLDHPQKFSLKSLDKFGWYYEELVEKCLKKIARELMGSMAWRGGMRKLRSQVWIKIYREEWISEQARNMIFKLLHFSKKKIVSIFFLNKFFVKYWCSFTSKQETLSCLEMAGNILMQVVYP